MKLFWTLCALAASLSAENFSGVITETMCGAKPHTMFKGRTDAECVRMCVKGPHVYALVNGSRVMKLTDQKAPAQYAAQQVTVTGTYDEKSNTLKVSAIEPAEVK